MPDYTQHQFSLFKPEEIKPVIKVPIKRISKERMEQAMLELKNGKPRRMVDTLRDINDSLEIYTKKHGL